MNHVTHPLSSAGITTSSLTLFHSDMNFYIGITSIMLFIYRDTSHLVILFSYFIHVLFTFPFLITKHQLGQC